MTRILWLQLIMPAPGVRHLLSQVPQDRLLVTESGISSAASVKCMREAGVHAFLVGEALLHFKDPGEGFRTLFDNPAT